MKEEINAIRALLNRASQAVYEIEQKYGDAPELELATEKIDEADQELGRLTTPDSARPKRARQTG